MGTIESVGTDAQRRILDDADSRYPAGSPAREGLLRQAALSGTYAAPDATGKIVRQSARNVPRLPQKTKLKEDLDSLIQ